MQNSKIHNYHECNWRWKWSGANHDVGKITSVPDLIPGTSVTLAPRVEVRSNELAPQTHFLPLPLPADRRPHHESWQDCAWLPFQRRSFREFLLPARRPASEADSCHRRRTAGQLDIPPKKIWNETINLYFTFENIMNFLSSRLRLSRLRWLFNIPVKSRDKTSLPCISEGDSTLAAWRRPDECSHCSWLNSSTCWKAILSLWSSQPAEYAQKQ